MSWPNVQTYRKKLVTLEKSNPEITKGVCVGRSNLICVTINYYFLFLFLFYFIFFGGGGAVFMNRVIRAVSFSLETCPGDKS